ncbi:Transcription factor IIIA [Vitis vinifera]|uniref:Transcription factor IIIA n=1 Tax=Vitis vinifera TaxID=29760 RepID=A0A438IZ15_VITVI|nr:Transcription factor IIIA [Vitis vinifera]
MLNGLVSGGELPEKLHQVASSHTTCFERPFTCPVDDCHSSYRRKVHLTGHLLKHQGKLFTCPVQNCNSRFAFQSNIKRHVKEFHDESPPNNVGSKQYLNWTWRQSVPNQDVLNILLMNSASRLISSPATNILSVRHVAPSS